MSKHSRRQFLENSMVAATAAAAAAWQANPASRLLAEETKVSTNPSEKLSVCCVGVRSRGGEHINSILALPGVEITHLVDPDETTVKNRAAEIAKKQGQEPKTFTDMRKAFDDKSIDCVTIATPNHWHSLAAIWAMQAGKDVYVEKPVSHNVSEGRRCVEVARKYNKICQTGTQSRSAKAMQDGIAYMQAGKIGEVKLARGLCYKRRPSIGPKGEYPVPAGLDYSLWAGPAPMAPITRPKFHYDWHWQWPYGNGDLGNQGIHQVDIARWGLGVDKLCNAVIAFGGRVGYEDAGETPNTEVCFFDYGDKSIVFEVRGLETKPFMGAMVGNIFHGSDGYLLLTADYSNAAAFDKDGNKVTAFHGDGDHFANFFNAVRTRKQADLNADIEQGHLSSALCHLGNISYRLASAQEGVEKLDQSLDKINAALAANELALRMDAHLSDNKLDPAATKFSVGPMLQFDPAKEQFVDNSAADAMLTREYRAPFVVPTRDKI